MKMEERVSNYMALLNNGTDLRTVTPEATTGSEANTEKPTAVQLADEEVRRERLDLIRQQLSQGTYSISGKDVADKMLNILKG